MRRQAKHVLVIALLTGCSCAAEPPSDAGLDSGLDAADAWTAPDDAWALDAYCPDTNTCVAFDSPPGLMGTCAGSDSLACQAWAETRAPGLDAVSTCGILLGCARADSCTTTYFDTGGEDAGTHLGCPHGNCLTECRCGDGPACDPGYVCARVLGDTRPRTCVCGCGAP